MSGQQMFLFCYLFKGGVMAWEENGNGKLGCTFQKRKVYDAFVQCSFVNIEAGGSWLVFWVYAKVNYLCVILTFRHHRLSAERS